MNLRPAFARLLVFLTLVVPSLAQDLVQIALEGTLSAPGGGRVLLAVSARVEGELRRAALDLHLAEGTDAPTVAALLAERAQALELAMLFPGGVGNGPVPRASLFFARAARVELRLPAGLTGRIVACEDAPSLVRILPPRPAPAGTQVGPARLRVAATTLHPVTGASGEAQLELELPQDGSATRASEQLFTRSVEAGWEADRPGNDSWQPIRVGDSSMVRGLSVEVLPGGSDWGLVLELQPPRQ